MTEFIQTLDEYKWLLLIGFFVILTIDNYFFG